MFTFINNCNVSIIYFHLSAVIFSIFNHNFYLFKKICNPTLPAISRNILSVFLLSFSFFDRITSPSSSAKQFTSISDHPNIISLIIILFHMLYYLQTFYCEINIINYWPNEVLFLLNFFLCLCVCKTDKSNEKK